jgi:hypothetical protein
MAPLVVRGGVAAGTNLALSLGQVLVYAVLRETNGYTDRRAYRILFASQWGFVAVGIIFLPFFIESPYWLVAHGREEKARANIIKLYGRDYDVESHLAFIHEALAREDSASEAQGGFLECFSDKNWRRTVVACSVFAIGNSAGTSWVVGFMSCTISPLITRST